MIRSLLCALALCLLGCSAAPLRSVDLRDAAEIDFTPPQPEIWRLANGLEVFFIPDHELPNVSGGLYLRGGTLLEDPHRFGVIGAMGSQMRDGGAGKLDAAGFDAELEKYSISIGSGFGEEFGQMTFSCLSPDLDRALERFADMVLRPKFQADRLALWKDKARDVFRRRRDDPNTVVGLSFDQLIYPQSNFGRVVVDSDLRAITVEALREAYARLVRPDQAILVLSGNLDQAQARAYAQRFFGDWKPRGERLPPIEPPGAPAPSAIYFVEQPLDQSSLLMGQRGVKRLTPDFAAIDVFNQVLSGGFGSRLIAEVREKRGLSYSVFGQMYPFLVEGKNLIYAQTKAGKTAEAMEASLQVLKAMQIDAVSASELDGAKRAIENSFVFRFEDPGAIARRAATMRMYGYPADYDQTYLQKVRVVSAADVREVALKHWDPAKFVVIVVGNQSAYNSLKQAVASPHSLLYGMALKRVAYNQSLIY